MPLVTLSPKFQVVIPRHVREALDWRPGQKLQALVIGDAVQLIPVRPMKSMKGFVQGIDTNIDRESDRV